MVDTSRFAEAVTVISVVRPVPDAVNCCTNGVTDALPKQADMLPVTAPAVITACAFANCKLASSAINNVSFWKGLDKSVHFLMVVLNILGVISVPRAELLFYQPEGFSSIKFQNVLYELIVAFTASGLINARRTY